jgi:hypothetical protein
VHKGVIFRVELREAVLIVPVFGVCIGPCLLGLKDKINFYPREFENLGLSQWVRKKSLKAEETDEPGVGDHHQHHL